MIEEEQLKVLLPLTTKWAKSQEKFILENGTPLSVDQQIDAHLVGVKDIKKVRLYKIETIPQPATPKLRSAAVESGLLSSNTVGISFRYGIYIKSSHWDDRRLIVHEFTHTMQYERLGSIQAFLEVYLQECLLLGYSKGALEKEARTNERKICGF